MSSSDEARSEQRGTIRSSVKRASIDGQNSRRRRKSYSMSPPREKRRRHGRHDDDRRSRHRSKYSSDESDNSRKDVDKENRYDRRKQRDSNDDDGKGRNTKPDDEPAVKQAPKTRPDETLLPTGGAYIPPARLRMMQQSIEDKNSVAYQRMAWEALKKSINGLVNKVNVPNIAFIVQELFKENMVRGRGVLAQSLMKAQAASPVVTNVYAALVAIVNMKFPKIGELLLRRLIVQFRRAFKRNDKAVCLSSTTFIAHLVNQQVAHELLALEILTLLLQSPTDDSVEVSIGFLKEVGLKLTELSPRGINAIFERLRNILHEAAINKRVQYMIEVLFAIRKDGFKAHPAVAEGLDLVEEEDQITHLLRLDDNGSPDDILNVFKHDPDYIDNEEKYKQIRKDILGEESGEESDDSSGSEDDAESDAEEQAEDADTVEIIDKTETNLVALRRTIYLTIQSSLDYEECAHKMMRINIKPGQEHEFCQMILDCCAQQRSFEKFFGLLAQRFCLLRKEYMEQYVIIFEEQYNTIHRLDTNKLRNVAKFFGHLLYSNGLPWTVMSCIHLNEDETTSSSRIFIKNLFQELSEYLGIEKLNDRLRDPMLAPFFDGLLPRDNPRNTRFAINFFTAIGLGGLTDGLREHLKSAPKLLVTKQQAEDSDSDTSSDSSSSDDDDSSSPDASSESSEEESPVRERRRSRKESSTRSLSSRSHKSDGRRRR